MKKIIITLGFVIVVGILSVSNISPQYVERAFATSHTQPAQIPAPSAPPQRPAPTPIQAQLPNPLRFNSLADLLLGIVNIVVSFSYVVVAFFLILSGFKFVAAQGSEEKLTDAKNTFKYTIIGAILVIGAQVIVSVLKSIFTQIVV